MDTPFLIRFLLFVNFLYAEATIVVFGARIEALGNSKCRRGFIRQRSIAIDLLHEISPNRQSHRGTLTHAHGVEMDVAILAAYPNTTDKLRREAHEPGVGITVSGTRLATDLSLPYPRRQPPSAPQASCWHSRN